MTLDAEFREDLIDRLLINGAIESPEMEEAVRAVPLHSELSRVFTAGPYGGLDLMECDTLSPTARQLQYIYSGRPIVTRLAEGRPAEWLPSLQILVCMIDRLRVSPGMKVLQIGSPPTSYVQRLVKHLLGHDGALSVALDDVDRRSGSFPGDGSRDRSQSQLLKLDQLEDSERAAHFDRILIPLGVNDIPPSWLSLLRPGGKAIVPLHHGGWFPILEFRALADGVTAGHIVASGGAGLPLLASCNHPTPVPARHIIYLLHSGDYGDADWWDPLDSLSAFSYLLYLSLKSPNATGLWIVEGGEIRAKGIGIFYDEDSWAMLAGGRHRLLGKGKAVDDLHHLYRGWVRSGRPGLRDYLVRVARSPAAPPPTPGYQPIALIQRESGTEAIELQDQNPRFLPGTPSVSSARSD